MLLHVERDHRLEHRHADLLPDAAAAAMEQRERDRIGSVHRRDLVGDDRGQGNGLSYLTLRAMSDEGAWYMHKPGASGCDAT